MLSQINIRGLLEPKNLFISWGKTIYIMNLLEALAQTFIEDINNLQTICTYFLIGVIVAALLEGAITKAGYPMTWMDRFWVILGWPLASAIFIWNFIKGYRGRD